MADRSQSEVLREIEDPATGNRWLLERDEKHPGGPGRLILTRGSKATVAEEENGWQLAMTPPHLPVIRGGDRIVLVTHTAVMDAELEGVALELATAGSVFRVRLKISGRVLAAIALGPGRAEWDLESGARP